MKKLITLLILSAVLAGCGTALFPYDTARTDRITFNATVVNINRTLLDDVCGRHAQGCTLTAQDGSKLVYMTGYPEGLRNREVTIQFVAWKRISGFGDTECGGAFTGTNSCLKDGIVYAYDFDYYDVENIWARDTITNRSEGGILGSAFAEIFGYPEKQFNYEQVLGHELMAHVVPREIKETL